jgi:uncharacterized membrane protein YfcA
MSSLLGIGGGLLITPYLLTMGIAPEAVVATSSFMIVCYAFHSLQVLQLF